MFAFFLDLVCRRLLLVVYTSCCVRLVICVFVLRRLRLLVWGLWVSLADCCFLGFIVFVRFVYFALLNFRGL